MSIMSGGSCFHYDCSNRNSFGYCKTTVCINEHYQREQWCLPSTTNKIESVVIKQQTNADRIRAMMDEELAEYLDGVCHDLWQMFVKDPQKMWLDWLKQEATNGVKDQTDNA